MSNASRGGGEAPNCPHCGQLRPANELVNHIIWCRPRGDAATNRDEPAPREHLTNRVEWSETGGVKPPLRKSREWYCSECWSRITIGADGTEYGHDRGYRPDGRDDLCPHHCYDGELSKTVIDE